MLFSEPKIPQSSGTSRFGRAPAEVSVLFSEPKIPQSFARAFRPRWIVGFSALQRAENSSIHLYQYVYYPKRRFSALQRAENSSILTMCFVSQMRCKVSVLFSEPKIPQYVEYFRNWLRDEYVSVLFSEPKIPQSKPASLYGFRGYVSVLFSEPKIPQSVPV